MAGLGTCDLCGKEHTYIKGTAYTDCFCKECLELVIYECEAAIIEIERMEEECEWG